MKTTIRTPSRTLSFATRVDTPIDYRTALADLLSQYTPDEIEDFLLGIHMSRNIPGETLSSTEFKAKYAHSFS